jgi:hypothetical protein
MRQMTLSCKDCYSFHRRFGALAGRTLPICDAGLAARLSVPAGLCHIGEVTSANRYIGLSAEAPRADPGVLQRYVGVG